MKLTLKQKRCVVVSEFKGGKRIAAICYAITGGEPCICSVIEQVIRDYMNGKFTIPRWFTVPKRKAK